METIVITVQICPLSFKIDPGGVIKNISSDEEKNLLPGDFQFIVLIVLNLNLDREFTLRKMFV